MFNMTQRADGQFNALQTKALFDSQQYATAIYQSELTYQLRNLGYTLETGKSGAPEIKGYSKEYLQASSPRREQIEEYLEKMDSQDQPPPRMPPKTPATKSSQ
jgi:conjugative relaxase-like TrwC/TraI family protein